MGINNQPAYFVFKGEHNYFKDGESYTLREYSEWTYENNSHSGVTQGTMKRRLNADGCCEPRHFLSVADFRVYNKQQGAKSFQKEKKQKFEEEESRRLRSHEWLKRALI